MEQYGNTYAPELNLTKPSVTHGAVPRVQGFQVFFVGVYATILTLSVTTISLTQQCEPARVAGSVLDLFIPLGLLGLGSALHTVPEGPPFSYLLWWFRVAMLYQLILEATTLGSICQD